MARAYDNLHGSSPTAGRRQQTGSGPSADRSNSTVWPRHSDDRPSTTTRRSRPTLRGDVAVGVGDRQARAEGLATSARRLGAAGAAVLVLGVATAAWVLVV
jgi:hypothetical protein